MVNTLNLKSYLGGTACDEVIPKMVGFSRLRKPTMDESGDVVDVDWADDVAVMAQNKSSGQEVDFSDEELSGAIQNLLKQPEPVDISDLDDIDFIELSDNASSISMKRGKDCQAEVSSIKEIVG